MLVSKKHSPLDHCKWRPETMTVPLKCMAASASLKQQRTLNRNICQMHCIFAIYGWKCSTKKYPVGRNHFRTIKKDCALKKRVPCD